MRAFAIGLALLSALVSAGGGEALASGGGGGKDGNLVRMVVMMPLLDARTNDVLKILPITIDLNADTIELKDYLAAHMANLQDAVLEGAYGKVHSDWGYDRIQALMKSLVDGEVGEERAHGIHLSIRVNVKAQ
ncbi:MAG: hypothetical protein WCF85_05805 [Rhodospirillaceae bacterium]